MKQTTLGVQLQRHKISISEFLCVFGFFSPTLHLGPCILFCALTTTEQFVFRGHLYIHLKKSSCGKWSIKLIDNRHYIFTTTSIKKRGKIENKMYNSTLQRSHTLYTYNSWISSESVVPSSLISGVKANPNSFFSPLSLAERKHTVIPCITHIFTPHG